MTKWIPWTFVAIGLAGLSCASPADVDDTSTGAAEGGQNQGGTSTNQGGAGGGTGGSGMGGASACVIDCSTIQVPVCLKAVCNASSGQCEVQSDDGAECNDGKFCTLGDTCMNGTCQGGSPNDCGLLPSSSCQIIVCSESSDSCSEQPIANDTPCAPADLCQTNTSCQNGLCVGVPKDCFFAPVPDSCHVGQCNPATGDCEPVPGNEGAACTDSGDLCMTGKTCQNGLCDGGTPKNCSAFSNGCNNGACDPGTGNCYGYPVPPGGQCLDGVPVCNIGICDDLGNCNPVPTPGAQCAQATNDCNIGYCNAQGQCTPTPANDGFVCNDGNSCTSGETCLAGACQGGMTGNYMVYFTETFASNAAGWQLDTEWQIGPAMSGTCPTGNPDPSADHTPTADNGLAGVVIGGCASTPIHPYYYLTSPIINTNVMGSVYLEFWRQLNSDYTPYMNNVIEVYNGSTWIQIWQSGPSPGIYESQWTKITHDITANKNANMRVRFGFNINSGGVFTVGSWNIDDIVIANQSCP